MKTKTMQAYYAECRKRGVPAKQAFSCAKCWHQTDLRNTEIQSRWNVLEDAGLVYFQPFPDDHCDFEDLCGDTYTPKYHPEIPEKQILREKEEFRELCERDGVWGIAGFYRTEPMGDDERVPPYGYNTVREAERDGWTHVDSCWGFVGNDYHGYEFDCMSQTVDALRVALRERVRVRAAVRADGVKVV